MGEEGNRWMWMRRPAGEMKDIEYEGGLCVAWLVARAELSPPLVGRFPHAGEGFAESRAQERFQGGDELQGWGQEGQEGQGEATSRAGSLPHILLTMPFKITTLDDHLSGNYPVDVVPQAEEEEGDGDDNIAALLAAMGRGSDEEDEGS